MALKKILGENIRGNISLKNSIKKRSNAPHPTKSAVQFKSAIADALVTSCYHYMPLHIIRQAFYITYFVFLVLKLRTLHHTSGDVLIQTQAHQNPAHHISGDFFPPSTFKPCPLIIYDVSPAGFKSARRHCGNVRKLAHYVPNHKLSMPFP